MQDSPNSNPELKGDGSAVSVTPESLERLPSSESDSEWGDPVLAEHLDLNQEPLVLKNWTAQDFADIYVRFHPHVLRHAKKFLTNHSQAEEVTQDAFLYLMTSLPEVDSEVGVLKLLKWKTRLLALDVIKASGGASFAPLDAHPELTSDEFELSQQLERADDAAVVALALAKLEPRQREALIASLYEEKSISEVAEQLGTNVNATKQLVFRAKASFKKALVGEAETRGLSLSQILSVAARKASKDAGKYMAAASALLLVLAVSVGILPNLGDSTQETLAGSTGVEPNSPAPIVPPFGTGMEQAERPSAPPNTDQSVALTQEAVVETEIVSRSDELLSSALAPVQSAETRPAETRPAETGPAETRPAVVSLAALGPSIDLSPFDPWLLDSLVEADSIQTSLLSKTETAVTGIPSLFTLVSDQGIWADVNFELGASRPFQRTTVGLRVGGDQYFTDVSQEDFLVLGNGGTSETYVLVGSIGQLRDTSGNLYDQTRLDGARVTVTLTVNTVSGQVGESSLSIDERS